LEQQPIQAAISPGFFLGIFPAIVSIANGYVLGFVSARVVGEEGVLTLWKLFPHGVFELPAIFISLGMGIKFASFIGYKKKYEKFKEFFWNSFRVFVFVIIPLLVVAAIIEGSLIYFAG